MTALHTAKMKKPYLHFDSWNGPTKAVSLFGTINKIFDRANRIGVNPTRFDAERICKRYSYFSKQPKRCYKSLIGYFGYGNYKNGKWDLYEFDIYRAILESRIYTEIETKIVRGNYPESIEKCKKDLEGLYYKFWENKHTELHACKSCGSYYDYDSVEYRNYNHCPSCNDSLENIDSELKETAEVKRLINKLKKVIKDENKRLEI